MKRGGGASQWGNYWVSHAWDWVLCMQGQECWPPIVLCIPSSSRVWLSLTSLATSSPSCFFRFSSHVILAMTSAGAAHLFVLERKTSALIVLLMVLTMWWWLVGSFCFRKPKYLEKEFRSSVSRRLR